MKALQRRLLTLAVMVIFLDMLFQLGSFKMLKDFQFKLPMTNWIFLWGFPLAFILGALVAILSWNLGISSFFIGLSMVVSALLYGGYTLTEGPDAIIFLHIIHGILLSCSMTLLLLLMIKTWSREDYRQGLCRLGLYLSLLAVGALSLNRWLSSLFTVQWGLYSVLFLYAFSGTLLMLLSSYWNISHDHDTSMDSRGQMSGKISATPLLAVITATFTLGFLYQHFIYQTNEASSTKLLALLFFISLALAFITKVGAVADVIGDSKGILMGFLLLAFSLCLFTLTEKTYFFFVPVALSGTAYGLLIPCLYGSFWSYFSSPSGSIFAVLYHILALLGAYLGYLSANAVDVQSFSPYLFICLIVISTCIPYIRSIHQEASTY